MEKCPKKFVQSKKNSIFVLEKSKEGKFSMANSPIETILYACFLNLFDDRQLALAEKRPLAFLQELNRDRHR